MPTTIDLLINMCDVMTEAAKARCHDTGMKKATQHSYEVASLLDIMAGAAYEGEYVGWSDDELTMTPKFLANLLRAGRSESVALGRVDYIAGVAQNLDDVAAQHEQVVSTFCRTD